MLYLIERRYVDTKLFSKIEIWVGTHLLGTLTGDLLMSLKSFNANQPAASYRKFASSSEKEVAAAFGIPFTIDNVREVESQFLSKDGEPQSNLLYDITFDEKSPQFLFVSKQNNIEKQLTLSFNADIRRQTQYEQELKPNYVGKQKLIKLVKQGRRYNFDDVETE